MTFSHTLTRRLVATVGAAAVLAALLGQPGPAAAAIPAPDPSLTIAQVAGGPTGNTALSVAQQPFGLATPDPVLGDLFVADPANHVLRMLASCGAAAGTTCTHDEGIWVGSGGAGTETGTSWFDSELAGPYAVAVSGHDIYLADSPGNIVRHYNPDTPGRPVDLVAGAGSAGFSGDGGAAARAQLNSPYGIAATAQKVVYIADTLNNRIRVVQPNGTIATVAGNGSAGFAGDGGSATAAQLDQPRGLAIDCSGGVLIADTANNVVRRFDPANRTISTLAGTGTAGSGGDGGPAGRAQLDKPAGLTVAPNCDVYVADTGNNAVRQIRGGTITRVAGTGTAGFTGDGGRATSARLNSPFAVAVLTNGNLAIADTGNDVIREVARGTISTMAGNGTPSLSTSNGDGGTLEPQLSGPTAVALDSGGAGGGTPQACTGTVSQDQLQPTQGAAITLDTFNHALRAVCLPDFATAHPQMNGHLLATTVVDLVGNGRPGQSISQLSNPMGLALGSTSDGDLTVEPPIYVADTFNNRILRVDTTTQPRTVTVIAGTGKAGYSGDFGPGVDAQLSYPTGLAFAAGDSTHDDALYIADTYNERIRKLDLRTGVITTAAGTGVVGSDGDGGRAIDAQVAYPFGLAAGFDLRPHTGTAHPALYIADTFNNRIREVDLTTGVIDSFAGGTSAGFADGPAGRARFDHPWGLSFIDDGEQALLYVADYLNNRIRESDGSTVSTATGNGQPGMLGERDSATDSRVNLPRGVASQGRGAGTLFLADTFNDSIRGIGRASLRFDSGGRNGAPEFNLPDARTGTSSSIDMTIVNQGSGFTRVPAFSTDNSAFTVSDSCLRPPFGYGLWPGESCNLEVTFSPTSPGGVTAHLFATSGPGTISTSVRLTGNGIQPSVEFHDKNGQPITQLSFSDSDRLPAPLPTPTPIPTGPTPTPCPTNCGFNTGGGQPIGANGTIVYVYNPSGAPLHISNVSVSPGPNSASNGFQVDTTCDSTATTCDPATTSRMCDTTHGVVAPFTQCELMVVVPDPVENADQKGTLTVTDDAAPAPNQTTQTLPISYTSLHIH